MKIKKYLFILLFLTSTCMSQTIPADSLYLSQTPPGTAPKIFVLPYTSQMHPVERLAITSDGKEIYYSELNTYPPSVCRIKCYKYSQNKWQGPFIVFEGFIAPALSVNDSIMYMQKNVGGEETSFYSVRTEIGWSEPVKLLSMNLRTHYYQETNSKNFYVSSVLPGHNGYNELCKLIVQNPDTTIQSLGKPINSTNNGMDFFIAKDESYLLFNYQYPGTASDFYISYKKNGNWTNPKSFGAITNTSNWEYGPYITKDSKYLFFSRGGNSMSSYFIYWVKIDGLIDSLMHTNFIPYLKNQIPNQTDTVEHLFNFTFSDSAFIDDDGNNTLTYSATLSNGGALPSWLSFNPATKTFSGIPDASGSIGIKVTATDTANAPASCFFTLNVLEHTAINESKGLIINEYKLFQNFPNPFNPCTVISYSVPKNSYVILKLYDVVGKEIAVLVNSYQKTGVYDVNLEMNKLNLSSGIYYYNLNVNEANSNIVFIETKMMSYIK
jgi:hypothetical protein